MIVTLYKKLLGKIETDSWIASWQLSGAGLVGRDQAKRKRTQGHGQQCGDCGGGMGGGGRGHEGDKW